MTPLIRWFPLFSLLSVTRAADVIGSHDTVKVVDGDDAILPCHLKEPFNVTTLSVLWKRDGTTVHLYRSKADDLVDQGKNFRDRTSLFPDELAKGTFSLTLTKVTELDAGNYTCKGRVKDLSDKVLRIQCNVTIIVEPKQSKGNPTKSPRHQDDKDNDTGIGAGFGTLIGIGTLAGIGALIGIGFGIYKCMNGKKDKEETVPEPRNDRSQSPRQRRRFTKKPKEKKKPEEIPLKTTRT